MKRQLTPGDFSLARKYAGQVEQQSDPFAYLRCLSRLANFGNEALETVGDRLVLVIE